MGEMVMSTKFCILIKHASSPWPFSWGPFGRSSGVELCVDEAQVEIYQQGDGGEPMKVELYASPDTCTTTVDFRGGTRLKRRTRF
jgi:hypothetical protein